MDGVAARHRRATDCTETSPAALGAASRTEGDPIVVWALVDGYMGHFRQIEGLIDQLDRRRPTFVHWIDVRSTHRGETLAGILRRTFPAGDGLQSPHIILAAGHTTHLPALAARHARGGRIVVLMRPTLPSALFDLCLVPEQDLLSFFGRLDRMRVVPTQGVLNPFAPSGDLNPDAGLILIGGPSRHHGWSDDEVLRQVQQIRRLSPATPQWTLTTSRRTPPSFVERLWADLERTGPGQSRGRRTRASSGHEQRPTTSAFGDYGFGDFGFGDEQAPLEVLPFEVTDPDWLPRQLSRSQTIFVTEDSISMVYEALTVGADVGLLHIPRRRRSRNTICIDRLITDRLVVEFDEWCARQFESRHREPVHEASRCADIVCERLLDSA